MITRSAAFLNAFLNRKQMNIDPGHSTKIILTVPNTLDQLLLDKQLAKVTLWLWTTTSNAKRMSLSSKTVNLLNQSSKTVNQLNQSSKTVNKLNQSPKIVNRMNHKSRNVNKMTLFNQKLENTGWLKKVREEF